MASLCQQPLHGILYANCLAVHLYVTTVIQTNYEEVVAIRFCRRGSQSAHFALKCSFVFEAV